MITVHSGSGQTSLEEDPPLGKISKQKSLCGLCWMVGGDCSQTQVRTPYRLVSGKKKYIKKEKLPCTATCGGCRWWRSTAQTVWPEESPADNKTGPRPWAPNMCGVKPSRRPVSWRKTVPVLPRTTHKQRGQLRHFELAASHRSASSRQSSKSHRINEKCTCVRWFLPALLRQSCPTSTSTVYSWGGVSQSAFCGSGWYCTLLSW